MHFDKITPITLNHRNCVFQGFLGGFCGGCKKIYTKTHDLSLSLLYTETYFCLSDTFHLINFSPKHKGLWLPIKLNTGPTAFSILSVFCVMLEGTSGCLRVTAWVCDWSIWWHKVQTILTCPLLFSHYNMEDFRLNVPFILENVYVYFTVYWKFVWDIEEVKEFTTTFPILSRRYK